MNPDILIIGVKDKRQRKYNPILEPFSVEKGIPMPRRFPRENNILGTLRKMEVGDSFLLPKGNKGTLSAIYTRGKQLGMRMTARANQDGSARVWRVK